MRKQVLLQLQRDDPELFELLREDAEGGGLGSTADMEELIALLSGRSTGVGLWWITCVVCHCCGIL